MAEKVRCAAPVYTCIPLIRFTASQKQQDPSPDSASAAAARIRNNQRRSRARHREFVDDLRAKIREYERQGVQATLDMRQAARKVALENARLRSLLASRGVLNEDVDRYLASFDDQGSVPLPMPALAPQANSGTQLPPVSDSGLPPPDRDMPSPNGASASALNTLAVAADASMRQTCCGPATQCSPADAREEQRRVEVAELPPSRGPASPSPGPNTPNSSASHLEMSCTTAANIMADMYRDGNKELAREALGCSRSEECLVKNTLVFQLLDNA
jgi:hypothetical protein